MAILAVGAIVLNSRQGGDTLAPATIPEVTVPASSVPNTISDSSPPATAVVPDTPASSEVLVFDDASQPSPTAAVGSADAVILTGTYEGDRSAWVNTPGG